MTEIYLDPDDLYRNGSQTFFYVPGEKRLFVRSYPESHRDMLQNDKEVFNAIWKGKEADVSDPYSRGIVNKYTDVLSGRVGIHPKTGSDIVVSFWKKPSKSELGGFFDILFDKYPVFHQALDRILIAYGELGPVKKFADVMGGEKQNPRRIVDTAPNILSQDSESNKEYRIGDHNYTLSDLQNLRSAIHTRSNLSHLPAGPLSVLCHPDLKKYPELSGYRPADCLGKYAKSKPRRSQDPYLYSYGEFALWVQYQDIFLD